MKNLSFYALIFSTIFLTGCGGGESDSGGGNDIKKFSITGTDGRSSKVAVIDPALREGFFEVDWNVDHFGFYWVRMAVSSDKKYGAGDRVFFDEDCGSLGSICPKGKASISCGFDNNNVIACDSSDSSNAWMGPNLSNFLTALPKRAFIVVEVCTRTKYFGCHWKSHPVEFR